MANCFGDDIHTKILTPREYQVELLDEAKERNTIICLCPRSGRDFIATKLIQELSNSIRRPIKNGGKRSLYLVDSVAMVECQAAYFHNLMDLNVGGYSEYTKIVDWEKELIDKQVLVMTYKVFCIMINKFLRIEDINLLILDGCHKVFQNHSMKKVMKLVSSCSLSNRPRILGLTEPILNSKVDPSHLEGEIRRLEAALLSTAETAGDIVSVLRYCAKPKEFVLECALNHTGSLAKLLEEMVMDAINFIRDHRYDPLEVYSDFFYELKDIPDPTHEPLRILNEFFDILHNLGPWCADIAAESLLLNAEKLKLKTSYERHFLLLCMVSTVLVRIRAVCDDYFKGLNETERILRFSSPKVLRLLEIFKQFKPEECLCVTEENLSMNDIQNCTIPECCSVLKNREFPQDVISVLSYEKSLFLSLHFSSNLYTITSNCCSKYNMFNSFELEHCGFVNNFTQTYSYPSCVSTIAKCNEDNNNNELSFKITDSAIETGSVKCLSHALFRTFRYLFESSSHPRTDRISHKNLNKPSQSCLLKTQCLNNCESLCGNYHANFPYSRKESENCYSNYYFDSITPNIDVLNNKSYWNSILLKSGGDNCEEERSDSSSDCKSLDVRVHLSKQPRKFGARKLDLQGKNLLTPAQDNADALCGIVVVEKKFTAKILFYLLNVSDFHIYIKNSIFN